MHYLLVFNPVSGRNESKTERLGKIVFELTRDGNEVTIYQTQNKQDAKKYIEQIQTHCFDRIVCCGGDGTLHEVINGIRHRNLDIVLGYIPMGSTNDYAKNLGITYNNALVCLKNDDAHAIDIGCINGEYFNYVAAFGAFTNIPFSTSQKLKNSLGYFAYVLEGIKQLSDVAPKHIRFSIDGKWEECDVILGMITNSFSVAGISNFRKKNVKLDDGMMEYLFIRYPKSLGELQSIITVLLSEKIDGRYMFYGQFETMCIESDPMEWTLDGESGGVLESANIVTYTGAVKLIRKTEI